jgi:formylglycine-generating enzyme required for sulfatase activity
MFACAISVSAITIDTVVVGDAGNSSDPATGDLYGSVNYTYGIGKYEVTVGQYAAFLNAIAKSDSDSVYEPRMGQFVERSSGIVRSGAPGSYVYTVVGSANHPISDVSWGGAARFANWLHNGQPSGPQNSSTTERGAYTLDGADGLGLASIVRSPGAEWFIPSEDEWYKAAYYQPAAKGGDADSYWKYPMKTNSAPFSDQPPGATPDNSRAGNFFKDDGTANGYDDGFAVTGSPYVADVHDNYVTDVASYDSSPSYYGTFDQGGNVAEWNEAQFIGSFSRGIRGGSWGSDASYLDASFGYFGQAPMRDVGTGFRIATIIVVPEPSSIFLFAGVFAAFGVRRRKSVPTIASNAFQRVGLTDDTLPNCISRMVG